MLASKLLMTVGGEEKLYSDDVFSAYTRAGTGADTTVTTGIDMTKGYMLWSKGRSGATDHAIYDSARGVTLDLVSNTTAAQTTQTTGLKSVSATGHTMGALAKVNTNAATYVDWVFRKATKFFDVVTYTGNGVTNNIPHSLGSVPGMIICKATSTTSDWGVSHKGSGGSTVRRGLSLNTAATALNNTDAASLMGTSTTFDANSVNSAAGIILNANGVAYVAYLFAHENSVDGIVQCGSFTTDGSGNVMVNLGWEPQYLMIKNTTTSEDWFVFDQSRGWPTGSNALILRSNTNGAESNYGGLYPNQLGFSGVFAPTQTYIYLAIRRSNKPPTLGTQVYKSLTRTGTGVTAEVTGVGFAPDLVMSKTRNSAVTAGIFDRLRGATKYLSPGYTNAEAGYADTLSDFAMDGVSVGADASVWPINNTSKTYINHFFKRAPGVFDQVCYTGTGVAKTEAHGLGVVPELMVVKARSTAVNWAVNVGATTGFLTLNTTDQLGAASSYWDSTLPTSSVFSLGNSSVVNGSASTYVAYLFATKAGISKVGSYTGNGTSQTINCGFTTGARFSLIKRTDSTGDWYVWDSVRGIVAGNDPHLSLNTTAAEVTTDDSIDPDVSGFIINQLSATNVNVNAASYIFLAFA